MAARRLPSLLPLVLFAVAAPALMFSPPLRADEAGSAPLKQRSDVVQRRINAEYDDLLALYKHLHTNPDRAAPITDTDPKQAKHGGR